MAGKMLEHRDHARFFQPLHKGAGMGGHPLGPPVKSPFHPPDGRAVRIVQIHHGREVEVEPRFGQNPAHVQSAQIRGFGVARPQSPG